jgi:hypothetical protein
MVLAAAAVATLLAAPGCADDAAVAAADASLAPDAGGPAPSDGGAGDAGVPDGGASDGGSAAAPAWHEAAPIAAGSVVPGLPDGVSDASLDEAGNVWAVDGERLYLVPAPGGPLRAFGPSDGLPVDELLSVSGAEPGVAWVGHRGQGDADDDPEWMRRTGGVTRVTLSAGTLSVEHFELSSPPGRYPQYPAGRYKLRTCLRAYVVKTGPHAGDAWFGCNHGAALVTPGGLVLEHHHPTYCEWRPETNSCTLRAGDVPAVAFTPEGDVWFGGAYGVGLLDYDDGGGEGDFWGPEPVRNLSLFAARLAPNEHGSEDVTGLAVGPSGDLWAASAHSGLARRRTDGAITQWTSRDGLPADALVDVAAEPSGALWVATAREGIHRLDPATGAASALTGLPSRLGARVAVERLPHGAYLVAVVRGAVAVQPVP